MRITHRISFLVALLAVFAPACVAVAQDDNAPQYIDIPLFIEDEEQPEEPTEPVEPPRKWHVDTFNRHSSTSASELAVARGLKWIAGHQQEDGSWSFDHITAPKCDGKCENPGADAKSVNAATALGLMPFFGCGITPAEGAKQYRSCVGKGLKFLVARQQPDGSFYEEGTGMVSHALATLAITEAYAMTKTKALREPAQKAVDFIVKSQNPDGGWSKTPGENSDTIVTGWQMMALRSGYMAYLKFPKETAQNAMEFFDSVQRDDGAKYLRTPGAEEPDAAATAAGLLCRFYYGWGKDNPALKAGVEYLSDKGPDANDPIFTYFATQVLHHYEGPLWRTWNEKMREQRVETQISDKNSHAFGSWYNEDAAVTGLEGGGRMAQTAISVMTLEVYYRYSPIYKKASVEGGFGKSPI